MSKTSSPGSEAHVSSRARVIAWSVHAFTASGAVIGGIALLEIGRGGFERAIVLMLMSMVIDAVDGTFARAARVSQILPHMDGRRLDDMVDFLNFVIVPVVFMASAGSIVGWGFAVLPILASCYGFSQDDAKTEDNFFVGFPSYWNILAIYLWLLGIGPIGGTCWLTGLSIAVFIPLRYIYPSKLASPLLRHGVSWGGLLWSAALAYLTFAPATPQRLLWSQISLSYPALYIGLSAWLGKWGRGIPSR